MPSDPLRTPFAWPHRVWFGAAFLFGLAFVFMLPPFQVNDEDGHWFRAWTLYDNGGLHCHTIPEAAYLFPNAVGFHVDVDHQRFHHGDIDAIISALDWGGSNTAKPVISAACGFFPLGYTPAYLAARLVAFTLHARPRVGGMICGYYAARLANWLMVSLGFLLLLRRLPWARNVGLFAYSIPEVFQQSVGVGLDAHLFFLTCLVLFALFGRASWCAVAGVIVGAILMTMAKPIYASYGALAFPLLLRLRARAIWTAATVVAAVLLPIVCLKLWITSLPLSSGGSPPGPGWVNPPAQIALLKSQPWHVFSLIFWQLRDTFGGSLMRGRWTGIFGAFGWSAHEMPSLANYTLLVALAIATVTDVGSGSPTLPDDQPIRGWRRLVWPFTIASVLLAFPAILVGMFIYFTQPGDESILGVQGRYYLPSLLILWVTGVWFLRRWKRLPERWQRPAARFGPWAACGLCLVGDLFALDALHNFFWT